MEENNNLSKNNKNPSKLMKLIHKAFLEYPYYFQNKQILLLPSLLGFIFLLVKDLFIFNENSSKYLMELHYYYSA